MNCQDLNQEEYAERMQTSRQTFQNIMGRTKMLKGGLDFEIKYYTRSHRNSS